MAKVELGIMGEKEDVMRFLTDVFESDSLALGMSKNIASGGIITLEHMPLAKGVPTVGHYVATIALAVGKAVSAARVVIDYLLRKRKNHPERDLKVIINRREWHFEGAELTRVIEERIKIEHKESE
jgi:hypothetical protein